MNDLICLDLRVSDDAMPLIERKSLADEVAAQLQEKILKGDYALNEKLPVEQQLMDDFGVGRSTIREAVKILVNSGYLRVQQGLGTFVKDNTGVHENMFKRLQRADQTEITEVRLLLEMKIAEKAAMNRTGNDISKLEHYLAKKTKAIAANMPEEYIDAHVKFYSIIAEASKNSILTDLFKSFAKEVKNEMLNQPTEDLLRNAPTDLHYKLLDSIIRQDAGRAWYWSAKITGQVTG
ncbi:MAG: FadR/GntR family transcriptional regulator [Mucilaginibacter sp.]